MQMWERRVRSGTARAVRLRVRSAPAAPGGTGHSCAMVQCLCNVCAVHIASHVYAIRDARRPRSLTVRMRRAQQCLPCYAFAMFDCPMLGNESACLQCCHEGTPPTLASGPFTASCSFSGRSGFMSQNLPHTVTHWATQRLLNATPVAAQHCKAFGLARLSAGFVWLFGLTASREQRTAVSR